MVSLIVKESEGERLGDLYLGIMTVRACKAGDFFELRDGIAESI